jgi:hypothetical protein
MRSPPLKPRISRFYRILLVVTALVVVGLPVFYFLWGVWAEHRLNQTSIATASQQSPPALLTCRRATR